MSELRIGVDTGGTFTDVAALDRGALRIHKLASTPADPGIAVVAGVAAVRDRRPVDVVHGTTVGLNAVLTGSHARVALVTNAGFRDLVEIGRQDRSDLYALAPDRARFPVARRDRHELAVRRDASGAVLAPLDPDEVARLVASVVRSGVDAVAVCLLHAHVAAADELAVARAFEAAGLPATASAALLPRAGEFERFTAACLNAAIRPVVGRYLDALAPRLAPGRIRLLRNSGGILGADEGAAFPLRAVLSGPAGGVAATARLAAALGVPRLAAFDMGGTSTDVALVGPDPEPADDADRLAGLPLAVPTLGVHTIGCGGGSLAYRDAGGALRVGPESAGADPGPACYGRGDRPTVTDAHVALGHIGPDTLLGGAFPIDVDRAVRAIERLAAELGTDPRRAAEGVLEVAEVTMARALTVITSERAVDPGSVPLCPYGGAAGLHAATLAARLGMPEVVVPPAPGVFSAIGLALAPETAERVEPLVGALDALGEAAVLASVQRLLAALLDEHRAHGGGAARRRAAEVCLRYAGQGRGLWIRAGRGLAAAFAAEHRRRFGFVADGVPVVVTEVRARVIGGAPRWPDRIVDAGADAAPAAPLARAPLGGPTLPVAPRAGLVAGRTVRGPALIVETTTVVRVPAGWRAVVDGDLLRLRRDD